MGACADALMLVLLDSNIYFSALISPLGSPARIVHAWRNGRFHLLTCQQQIDEIRAASRNLKFRALFQPHHVGDMLNHLYSATVWPGPLPRKHEAADPEDSYLLDLIEAAQPDYRGHRGQAFRTPRTGQAGSHQDSEGQYLLQ